MNSNNVKKRNWAFVLYPESAPGDWRDKLRSTGLQCAISPLHDKDLEPTGEPKKAHFHVIVCYSGPTSFNVVNALTKSLNQPIPQALEQVKGYYRYFTHKDNPEKFQYNSSEITTLNGFNIQDFVDLTKSEVIELKKQVQAIIRSQNIFEYSDLLDFLMDNDLIEFYDIASSNTLLFNNYITSRRNKLNRELESNSLNRRKEIAGKLQEM